jgi:hypothetical protein
MLNTIQEMKFFLRTGFGELTDFASSMLEIKTQRLCQGNGASPAGWAVIRICIINAHKKKGCGTHFIFPITKLTSHIARVIYVEDTDIHFCMDKHEDKLDILYGLQEAMVNWGKLLLASGGTLKSAKCSYHLISFQIKGGGSWSYKSNEEDNEFSAVVTPDGSLAPIAHLGIHESTKMRGLMTCPLGCNKGALKYMLAKSTAWRDIIDVGKLSR